MKILKREAEGVLNMLGALGGTAWKLMENYDLADAEKPDATDRILKVLDKAFEYDSRVQLPQDFDKFFTHLHRRPGQTLLQYVTDRRSATGSWRTTRSAFQVQSKDGI